MAPYVYSIQTEMTSLKASNRQLQSMVGQQVLTQDPHVSRTLLSRFVYCSVMFRVGCCACDFIAFFFCSIVVVLSV